MVEFANELPALGETRSPLGHRDGGARPVPSNLDDQGGDDHGPLPLATGRSGDEVSNFFLLTLAPKENRPISTSPVLALAGLDC